MIKCVVWWEEATSSIIPDYILACMLVNIHSSNHPSILLHFSPWRMKQQPAPGVRRGRSQWSISPNKCPPHLVTPHHQRPQIPPARWRKYSTCTWTNTRTRISRHFYCPKDRHVHTHYILYSPYLEGDTAYRQILAVLQHAQVFCHQGGAVHQTLSSLGVVVPLRVFSSHVLKPRQPQVWRRLVTFCNPGDGHESKDTDMKAHKQQDDDHSAETHLCILYLYMRSINISGSSWCSFILTVSDRIMCRLNTRSWTWK